MFITIDLVHEEAPAFWSQSPSQEAALGWMALSLMGMLSIRIYFHGHKAAPSCMAPSRCSRAGQGRASWRDHSWLVLVAEDLTLSDLSWAQLWVYAGAAWQRDEV